MSSLDASMTRDVQKVDAEAPANLATDSKAKKKHLKVSKKQVSMKSVNVTEKIPVSTAIFEHLKTHENGVLRTLCATWHKDMRVPVKFYLNEELFLLMKEEVQRSCELGDSGFLPALSQLVNVACLPGIVEASIGLPDIHSGYGFSIGHVAAFDMDDPEAIVSPGGVGYDINCGVRLIRSNLKLNDVLPVQQQLTDALYSHLPVGVGVDGPIRVSRDDLEEILNTGIDWAVKHEYASKEDKEHCEELGRMEGADHRQVGQKAKHRGISQLGTLGAGNHYAEIQVVDEIYDEKAALTMGVQTGTICVMIHCGSRGLGHQVATDYVELMQSVMARDKIPVKDLQLACAKISSKEGQNYLKAMSAAANFAYCNRSILTHFLRKAFEQVFSKSWQEMDMQLVYDVSHNMAKEELHVIDNREKRLLVHRKGSTRAFPPHHPLIPADYQEIGQPVLVGGSMGTFSHVLTGSAQGMRQTFGSTCHGAGRAISRSQSKKQLPYETVLSNLKEQGITIAVANVESIAEEAPESYKDVNQVVDSCAAAGISTKAFRMRPIGVIKG